MRKRYFEYEPYPLSRDVHQLDMGDGTFVLISGRERLQGITPNEIRAQEAGAAMVEYGHETRRFEQFVADHGVSVEGGYELTRIRGAAFIKGEVLTWQQAYDRMNAPEINRTIARDALKRRSMKQATRAIVQFDGIDRTTYPRWRAGLALDMPGPDLSGLIRDSLNGAMRDDESLRTDPLFATPALTPRIALTAMQRRLDEAGLQQTIPRIECSETPYHGWNCSTCGTHGSTDSEAASVASMKAHTGTPEHDRAEEKRLRKNVETARERLYDYLKGKGRVA